LLDDLNRQALGFRAKQIIPFFISSEYLRQTLNIAYRLRVLPTNHSTNQSKTPALLIDVHTRTVTNINAASLSHAAIAEWINASLRHEPPISRLYTWSFPNGDTMFFDGHRNHRTLRKAGGKGFHLPALNSIRHILGNALIIGGTFEAPNDLRTAVAELGIEWKDYPSRRSLPQKKKNT
jgi:hypothetical protein